MMLTISEINRKARRYIFGDIKIPSGISNPVLYCEEGKFYIAYFGYTYNKINMTENRYSRPSRWMLVDVENGELINIFDCTEKDFSTQVFDKLYSLNDPTVKKGTAEYFKVMDMLFDTARASVIYGNTFNNSNYQAYLNNLNAITPEEYRVFYKELSI